MGNTYFFPGEINRYTNELPERGCLKSPFTAEIRKECAKFRRAILLKYNT